MFNNLPFTGNPEEIPLSSILIKFIFLPFLKARDSGTLQRLEE